MSERKASARGAAAGSRKKGSAPKASGRTSDDAATPPENAGAAPRGSRSSREEQPSGGGRRYHKPDTEFYSGEARRAREFGDANFYDWVDGHNELRILPPWSPAGRWSKLELTHFQLPPDRKVTICLDTFRETHPDGVCPICDKLDLLAAKFSETGDDFDRWGAKARYLVNALDVRKNDGLVYVVRLPVKVYYWITKQTDNPRIGEIFHPDEGFDLDIMKSGKGLNTEYSPALIPDRCPLADTPEATNKILEGMTDLDKLIKFPDDQRLANIDSMAARLEDYFENRGRRPARDDYDSRARGRGGEPRDEADVPISPDGGARRGGRGEDRRDDARGDDRYSRRTRPAASRDQGGARDDRGGARDDRGGARDDRGEDRGGAREPRGTRSERAHRPEGRAPDVPGRGAPECYGDWRQEDSRCQVCPNEYDCQDETEARSAR